mgnify:CR=1 FL=1
MKRSDLGKLAGANLAHVTSELGGKAALIVFPDCNLDQAVNGAAFATFIASGVVDICIMDELLLVLNALLLFNCPWLLFIL